MSLNIIITKWELYFVAIVLGVVSGCDAPSDGRNTITLISDNILEWGRPLEFNITNVSALPRTLTYDIAYDYNVFDSRSIYLESNEYETFEIQTEGWWQYGFGDAYSIEVDTGGIFPVTQYFTLRLVPLDTDDDEISNLLEVKKYDLGNADMDPYDEDRPGYSTSNSGTPYNGTLITAWALPWGNTTDSHNNGAGPVTYSNSMESFSGYWYYRGIDDPDTDNWGTEPLLKLVQDVGAAWQRTVRGPGTSFAYITSMDMSKEFGGDFSGHNSHENGLDVDIRYIRNDGTSGPFSFGNTNDFDPPGINKYDAEATRILLSLILEYGNIDSIYLDGRAFWTDSRIVHRSDHYDHMHIRIKQP